MEESCNWYDVGCWLGWLSQEIKLLLVSFWETILDGLAYVIESIPVPDFLQQMQSTNFDLPPAVVYWTDFFEIPFGLAVFTTALVARFILRRIPLIG